VLRGLAGVRRLFHSPSPVRHGGAFRRRSWGSPFAVLLLPAGPRRFRPGLPPAVSRTIHPGLFSRGAGAGVRLSSSAGRGRSPRLLGFVPADNPFRRLLAGFRRPRLPWAFSSLRFADRRLWRVGAASCSDVIGNPAAEPRGSRHVLEQLIARDQQPQCPASGAYPLVGLRRIIPGVRRDHTVGRTRGAADTNGGMTAEMNRQRLSTVGGHIPARAACSRIAPVQAAGPFAGPSAY
jgi:hypothetical protein